MPATSIHWISARTSCSFRAQPCNNRPSNSSSLSQLRTTPPLAFCLTHTSYFEPVSTRLCWPNNFPISLFGFSPGFWLLCHFSCFSTGEYRASSHCKKCNPWSISAIEHEHYEVINLWLLVPPGIQVYYGTHLNPGMTDLKNHHCVSDVDGIQIERLLNQKKDGARALPQRPEKKDVQLPWLYKITWMIENLYSRKTWKLVTRLRKLF